MAEPRIVVSNDDGVSAEGLHALTRALAGLGEQTVVVAPAENRSGVARLATYGSPVRLDRLSSVRGIDHFACHGSPVDCIRSALLGELAAGAELVISGINHGPNLGDDALNSGTVAAAAEGALLGVPAMAISQQYFDDHFHILDALDQTTPVYDATGEVGALFAEAMLVEPAPDRAFLNINVPANIRNGSIAITRLGRRFYERGALRPVERDGVEGYLTYGERTGPAPPFEYTEGTDFGALKQFRVSVTPVSLAWHDPEARRGARAWAERVCAAVEPKLARKVVDEAP